MFDYMNIDLKNKANINLFDDFYNKILVSSFAKDQIENYEQFLNNLNNKDSYFITLVLNKDEVVGGIIYDYLKQTNSGFIEYIAVKKDHTNNNIGSNLLNQAISILNQKSDKKIDFLFCELEQEINGKQPKHYFWQKFGFKKIDFDYIQPPLDDLKKPVFIMDFGYLSFVKTDKKITKQLLIDVLNEYYVDYIDNEYFIQCIGNIKKAKKI